MVTRQLTSTAKPSAGAPVLAAGAGLVMYVRWLVSQRYAYSAFLGWEWLATLMPPTLATTDVSFGSGRRMLTCRCMSSEFIRHGERCKWAGVSVGGFVVVVVFA